MKSKLLFGVSFSFVFIFGIVLGASAGSLKQAIKAYLDPTLKVELNGENVTFSADTPPIRYNDRVYLPLRQVVEMSGLNSHIEYLSKSNKVKIGGPMYLNIDSNNGFYQIIINGNWGPSYITETKKMYSNSFMGTTFSVETMNNLDLNNYTKLKSSEMLKYQKIISVKDGKIFGKNAKVIESVASDSHAKTAIIQNGTDYVTIEVFFEKSHFEKYKGEYDKIINTFNIQ